MAKRSAWTLLLLLLLCAVAGVLLVHAHAGHDHGGHAHGAAAAAVKKPSTKAPARRMPPTAEAAHGHNHDHDHHAAHAPDGANDHDHDHDGHDDHDGHRTLKGSVAAHAAAHDGHDHDGHGHEHAHHGHAHHGHAHGPKTPAPAAPAGKKLAAAASTDRFSVRIWSEALFATALVGAAPVVVLLFVPLGVGSQEAQKPLLRVFLSFAAGGLLGDALLHLLPHSMPHGSHDHVHDYHDHGHNHDDHDHGEEGHHSHSLEDLSVWLWTIAGMMTFLMLEKFVRAQTGGHGHSHSGGAGHGHSHGARDAKKTDAADASTARKRKGAEKELDDVAHDHDQHDEHDHGHAKQPIAAAGYLNLAADFAHNFTDGLAIGATFLRGSGWSTTVAMLLHELPHEIGDFAILIQSGFTRREAMLTQLLTAIGAMVDTVIGLLMEGAGDSNSAWISPFTAGGFIYIACASVMPELLEDCSLWQSLKEAAAMCLGIGLMIIIALNE